MIKRKLIAFFNSLALLVFIGIFTPVLANNNDEIVLPIKLTAQGYSVVSIQIQGNDIPLIFDNGASRTSITLSEELVKKLNLKLIPVRG